MSEYEHVTAPRRAWYETERGKRTIIKRQLEGQHGFYIGKVINLADGRMVSRNDVSLYEVREFGSKKPQAKFKTYDELIDYLHHSTRGIHVTSISTITEARIIEEEPPKRFVGVRYCDTYARKWKVELRANGHYIYLGHFATDIEGVRAYDNYVIAHGLNRPLNLPQDVEQLEDVA